MSFKVVHCGTGNVGSFALRQIIDHPDLELVGRYLSTPEKVACDSGEVVSMDPVGVTATDNWADLVALTADRLTYFGNTV